MAISRRAEDGVGIVSSRIRPDPDPTVLTTQQLQREVSSLKELFEVRLDALDKATTLLQSRADKSPSIDVVYEVVKSLERVNEEKFHSITTRFAERDKRSEQAARDGKLAIDAALQAAKEAVAGQNTSNAQAIAKSETAFTKQIDQLGTLINTLASGLNEKIDDTKNRLTAGEGHSKGLADGWGYLVGGVGLLIGIVSFAVNMIRLVP